MKTTGEDREELERLHRRALEIAREAIESIDGMRFRSPGSVPDTLRQRTLDLADYLEEMRQLESKTESRSDDDLIGLLLNAEYLLSNSSLRASNLIRHFDDELLSYYYREVPLWERLLNDLLRQPWPNAGLGEMEEKVEARLRPYEEQLRELSKLAEEVYYGRSAR